VEGRVCDIQHMPSALQHRRPYGLSATSSCHATWGTVLKVVMMAAAARLQAYGPHQLGSGGPEDRGLQLPHISPTLKPPRAACYKGMLLMQLAVTSACCCGCESAT
jgi:hypothetical protein